MMLTAGMDAEDGNSNLLGEAGVGGDGAVEPTPDGIVAAGGTDASAGTPEGAIEAVETSLRHEAACSTTLASKVRSFRLANTCAGSRISLSVGQLSALHPRVTST
jgi:hypothetical protein